MASKLSRFTQSIFGSTASNNQIAEFGSLASGTPLTYSGATITPAIVQALSNYLTGWFGAVVGSNSPAIEDMNALFYLMSYQLAYGFQAGLAEYDAGTTYFTNSMVQSGGTVYMSLVDNNVGFPVTNGAKWGPFQQNGSVIPNTPNGNFVCTANAATQWPYLKIANGQTFTVGATSQLVVAQSLTNSGTLTVTGIVRIL